MIRILTAAAAFLFSSLFGAALAQTPPSDAVKAMLGNWEISNADRDKICIVTLRPQTTAGGMKLEFDKACAGVFPFVKTVSAWTLGSDSVRLVDAKGNAVLDASEVEDGMFQGERREEGLYFLQRPGAANPDTTPERFPGD
jgi:hypothetical protein